MNQTPRKKPAKKAVAKKAPAKKVAPPSDPQPARDGEVFDPEYRAHQLRLRGTPWREVAQACGYANEVTACMAVTAYLQRAAMAMSKERAQEALQMEIDFLDAMKAAWYTEGVVRLDEKAANVLLKISAQKARLLENFAVDQAAVTSRTVVISGGTEEYVAGLRAVVEGSSAAQ